MIKSWKEMTIADQIKIREISELQLASDDEKNLRVAAHLAGITYEEIMNMPLTDVRRIMDNTDFLLHAPVPVKARKNYKVRGRVYNLLKDPSEMTVAQFIDFQSIFREGFDKYPAEMLSIFLVPDGHQYNDGYDRDQQMEDMQALGVEEALGICDFFIGRCRRSIQRMATYSKVAIRLKRMTAPKEQREMLKALEIQTRLIMDASLDVFGSIVSGR